MKIKNIKEYRLINPTGDKKVRAATDSTSGKDQRFIEGYAAVFNQPSKMIIEFDGGELREFYEVITPDAFNEVLASPELDCIYNIDHNNNKMIARTKSSTLTLSVDDYGLKFRALVPNTTAGNDLYEHISLGNYSENSFCFSVLEENELYSYGTDGTVTRTITNIYGLYDVASVINPAYHGTSLSIRGLNELQNRSTVQPEAPIIEQQVQDNTDNDLIDLEVFIASAKSI